MNPLRKDARFQEMVRRVGLPGWGGVRVSTAPILILKWVAQP